MGARWTSFRRISSRSVRGFVSYVCTGLMLCSADSLLSPGCKHEHEPSTVVTDTNLNSPTPYTLVPLIYSLSTTAERDVVERKPRQKIFSRDGSCSVLSMSHPLSPKSHDYSGSLTQNCRHVHHSSCHARREKWASERERLASTGEKWESDCVVVAAASAGDGEWRHYEGSMGVGWEGLSCPTFLIDEVRLRPS